MEQRAPKAQHAGLHVELVNQWGLAPATPRKKTGVVPVTGWRLSPFIHQLVACHGEQGTFVARESSVLLLQQAYGFAQAAVALEESLRQSIHQRQER